MRALVAVALLAIVALLAWRWASGAAAQRGEPATREGPGEPAGTPRADAAAPDAELPGEATAPAPADLPTLSLRVVDEAGAPVAGAWVEVRRDRSGEAKSRALSDGLGCATVRLTRQDEVFVGARGFQQTRVTSPLRRRVEEVVLRRGYDISGVVVDGAGRGIAGARLALSEPFLPQRTGASGSDGRFAFEDVSEHEMPLEVQADGYITGGGIVMPGDGDVRVVLFRPVTVSGVVVFADGSPAVGAQIGPTAADAGGRFTLCSVEPGPHRLAASLEANGRRWTAEAVVEVGADGSHEPIRLVLEPRPRSWISVLALDAAGSPASAAIVVCPLMGANPPRTAADGRTLCVLDVPVGTRTAVEVAETRTDGLLPGKAIAVTGERDGPEVVLRPREPSLVAVVVRCADGSPLPPGADARVEASGNRVVSRDAEGALVAADPMASMLYVRVEARGFLPRPAWGPPPASGRLEVRLHGAGSLSCRLVNEAGLPVEDGFVRATVEGVGADSTGDSDSGGVYRIDAAPAGRAVVTAGRSGNTSLVRVEAEIRAGEERDLGTLILGAPRELAGSVTDASGRPVGGARVEAVERDFEAGTFSRSDGSFRIPVHPWFDGRVLATKSGYGAAHARAGEGAVRLELPQEGWARLEVRLPPVAAGVRGYHLDARDPSTGFQWSLAEWSRIEGTTYLLKGLPPGRLILVVSTLPKNGEAEVVVVPGQTVRATVDVPE